MVRHVPHGAMGYKGLPGITGIQLLLLLHCLLLLHVPGILCFTGLPNTSSTTPGLTTTVNMLTEAKTTLTPTSAVITPTTTSATTPTTTATISTTTSSSTTSTTTFDMSSDPITSPTSSSPSSSSSSSSPTSTGFIVDSTAAAQQGDDTDTDTYSFLEPGRSYVEYRPPWSGAEQQPLVLEFSFRTHKSSTFLLHSSFARDAAEGDDGRGRFNGNLWVTLQKGVLLVTHMYQDQSYTLKLGKGLGHDHWHTVQLSVHVTTGDISATVDGGHAENQTVSPTVVADMRQALVSKTLTSIASIGGFSPEMLQAPSEFVGCVRGVRFIQGERQLNVPIHSRAEVTDGCVNACDTRNLCVHGGSCLNYYAFTTCDCFGTGYEGQFCERPGGTVVTLQGSEWISYVISDVTDRTHSPINKVALEFKTRSTEGVLFYGYSQSQYNHLALSLHNASLHVSVVFIDQDNYDELWVALGARLNDNRWHRVVVSHHGHEVQVELDAQTQKMTGREDQRHLRMDPAVFIGGLENAHKALGLRSQQKFVGCLRAVYFNHDSVLEKLRFHQAVYHGGLLQYGCQDMEHTALQFPHKGAFVKAEHRSSDQLRVELEFRTLKPDSILLYTEMISGADKGYVQLLLQSGQVNLIVVPSVPHPQVRETASVGESLNDNQWHSLKLDYNRGTGRLEVDGEVSIISVRWDIHIARATYVGFGPDTQMKYGYVGCMRNVVLQDRDIDPVEVVHTQLGVGVTLGPCHLRDLCLLNGSNCQNGGMCVSVWTETYCECERTHNEGKFCQFTKLRRTCAEYFQAGETRSGVWAVDIDGSGPLPPTHVYCEMGGEEEQEQEQEEGEKEGKNLQGVTRVNHNLAEGTMVRDSSLVDHKKVVTYRELTPAMLDALIQESVTCHQWVHVNCSQSPLRLGELTWLVSSSGKEFNSFGSDTAGVCGCGERHSCVRPDLTCNCDADSSAPNWDGGYIRLKHHLPVTELIFRQGPGPGQANVTMGPLRCQGTRSQSSDTVVTFMTPHTYLKLEGWRGGTLEFDFRSTSTDAFLLYQGQPGQEVGPWSDAQFYIMIKNGQNLVIHMSSPPLWRTVRSSRPLSDGRWQHVSIELASGQARVQVNADRYLYDVTESAHLGPDYWASILYVGGRPNRTGLDVSGVSGCIRGLIYNNKLHPLADRASSTDGVAAGCAPACDSYPCQHGATCEELWTSYVCHCSNKFAHSGSKCEVNINQDAVSFLGKSDFLEFHQPGRLDLGSDQIIFSFRTFQQSGLLLYLCDHLNNFLQFEVRGHSVLGIRYNNQRKIANHDLAVTDITDGKWKQVAVKMHAEGIEIILDGKRRVVEHMSPWKPLTTYEPSPFGDQESVVPLRRMTADTALFHVYVGGVLSAMSAVPGVIGCIRGLKVGSHVIQLEKSARESSTVHVGCLSGCASSPCQHRGLCVEDASFSGHYTCDCIGTGFAGRHCDKEVGAFFDGSTVLIQNISSAEASLAPRSTAGRQEGLHLNFATYNKHDQPRVLVFVPCNNRHGDYLLLYLTPGGVLVAEASIKNLKVSLETGVSFINGWAHHVSLHREDVHVILQVDNMVVQRQLNNSVTLDPPTSVVLGGMSDDSRFAHMDNFTGDISNVYFVSDWLPMASLRPLDSFFGHTDPTPPGAAGLTMTVRGHLRPATQPLASPPSQEDAPGPVVLSGLPETASTEMWTFPPWSVGPARTVNLAETPGLKPSSSSEAIGVLVCLMVILSLTAIIAVLLVRAGRRRRRRKKGVQQATPYDEEEGLIEMVATAPEEEEEGGPVEGEVQEEDVRGRRPRGVRGIKSPSSRSNIHDDENEETPMLSNMEETGTSRPPGEKVDFMRMIESLPMIDDDEEEREHSVSQDSKESPPSKTEKESSQGSSQSGSTAQLEWDPQLEMKLVQPLMPLTYCEPVSSTSLSLEGSSTQGEVWTESQVLAMLENDEPVQMMWDSNEDLFVDANGVGQEGLEEQPACKESSSESSSVDETSGSPPSESVKTDTWSAGDSAAAGAASAGASGHRAGLMLGLSVGDEDSSADLSTSSSESSTPTATTMYSSPQHISLGNGRVASCLSPKARSPAEAVMELDGYDSEDIPRVSSQIDLSADLRTPTAEPEFAGLPATARQDSSLPHRDRDKESACPLEPLKVVDEHVPSTPAAEKGEQLASSGSGGPQTSSSRLVAVRKAGKSSGALPRLKTSPMRATCRPLAAERRSSSDTSSSERSLDGDLMLSPSQLVLPPGTRPLQPPDGISPGLTQRRGFKLRRSRKRTK